MNKTLSLSPRTHLFIKDEALWIKLQRPHKHDPMKADYYIIKKFKLNQIQKIHEWTGEILKENEESK